MTLRLFRSIVGLVMIMLLVSPFAGQPVAHAATVVGSGTPAGCTEQAFDAALSNAGTISFNCGAGPHTITLTTQKVIRVNTRLEGADLITLSGGKAIQLFTINPGVSMALDRITIADGFSSGDGGAIRNNGTLIITRSTLRDNVAASTGSGGAIVSYGPLTIDDSILEHNSAGNGGALYPRWTAAITTIRNSVLRNNSTTNQRDGWGGAILVWDGATAIFENTRLISNTARYGGAIYSLRGALTIRDRSAVNDNRAEFSGGALYATHPGGSSTIVASSINNNTVTGTDGEGGAIFNQGQLRLESVTTSGNRADIGAGLSSYGISVLTNTTLSANAAKRGGGIFNHEGGETTLYNSTLYANQASVEGGNVLAEFGGVQAHATIFAAGSCAGAAINSQGYNLDSANNCGLDQTTDLLNTDPRLAGLDDNGGPTLTHLPLANSPVIDNGGTQCPATDQRGIERPQGQGCDIGAVEAVAGNATCGGTLEAVADTTINSAQPAQAADGDASLRVSRNAQGETQALIRFDLAGRLPAQSTIISATLQLPIVASTSPVSDVLDIYGLRTRWSQGVTWNTRPISDTSYGQTVAGLAIPEVRIDLTTLVTHWATGAVTESSVLLAPGLPQMDLHLRSRDTRSAGPSLQITCTPAPEEIPTSEATTNQEQRAAFSQLEDDSASTVLLQVERGAIRFADFKVTVPDTVEKSNLAQAEWFFKTYSDALRLTDKDDLQLIRRSEDEQSLFFRQVHASLPVYGAELVIHLDGKGHVDGLGGNYLPGITLGTDPSLTAARALELATTASPGEEEILGDTQLRYFNARLLGQDEDRTTLAWQVNLRTPQADQAVFVDAHTGAILFQEPRHNEGYDLDLENGNNELPQDLCGLFDDDDVSANFSPDARRVADNMRSTYNYWRNTFGRDSYDNDGEQIEVNVNVGGAPNASYMGCDIFTFSNGWTMLDIVAHEFGHAVDANEGQLIYANQSGALDESFADIWGHFIDNGDWLIGEDLAGGAIRDMSNPPAFSDPDTFANYFNTTTDNGGVHTNSGINNKAAFLITDGGTHRGFTVQGLGQANAQRLFHNVFTGCLWNSSQLIDARNCAVNEAGKLGLRLCTIRNAYASVGLGQGDRDCDNIEDNVDPDADGDWTPDFRDNCINLFNPAQNNVDRDALGDDCDPDIDGDGVANLRPNGTPLDNCRYVPNPGQADFNSNGVGDACDDRDGDGHIDVVDNCPNLFNDQSNVDRDSLGDACDPDIDNDGLGNAADNCSYVANAGQENRDGDAFGDACDGCPDLNNPDNGDVDRDGLGNPCDPDADNDGICNIGGPLTGLPGLLPTGCVAGAVYPANPAGIDNCPLVSNTSQIDRDKNGLGLACDRAELEELVRSVKDYNDRIQFREKFPVRIPLGFCPQCGERYLPDQFETVINLVLPRSIQARVINSAGIIVAKPWAIGAVTQLRFNPVPFAGNFLRLRVSGAAGAQATPLEITPTANDTNYYLELIPGPDIDPTKSYPVTGTITETLPNQVFLPAVRR